MTVDDAIRRSLGFPDSGFRMPVLFVGHGNPMNAIEDNEFSCAWTAAGSSLPIPRAVLCISAHWQTAGAQVTVTERPKTMHDFYGFPRPLYEVLYPAPGSPALAHLAGRSITTAQIRCDANRGLDHGAWSVLSRLFPRADVPVIQLSLDHSQEPPFHYQLGSELRALRRRGVLILGSGNVVHNLRLAAWQDIAFDWAVAIDQKIGQAILSGDHQSLIAYDSLGPDARLAVPTHEHYLPLLYVLGLQEPDDEISFFAEKVTLGSISMRSIRIG